MPADKDETLLREATARLVDIAKYYPFFIQDFLEYHLDTDLHDVHRIYALEAIHWAMTLRVEAAQTIRGILSRSPDRSTGQTSEDSFSEFEP